LAFIEEATSCAERGEIRFYNAEIWRVRGNLLDDMDNRDEARACYQKALDIAGAQGTESLRLRAEASLKATFTGEAATGTS
jgi:predicted RNA polymerase sigma factor